MKILGREREIEKEREREGGDDGKRGRGITTEIETVRKREERKEKGVEREKNQKEIESRRETEGNELTPPPLIHVHFPFNRFLA